MRKTSHSFYTWIKSAAMLSVAAVALVYLLRQFEIQKSNGITAQMRITHCYDGDTCRLNVNDELWLNVRLAGVDAPEIKTRTQKTAQPFGAEARDWLNATLKGKSVTARQVDLDRYNRPIVEIFLNKENINLKLIEQGYGERYRGKTKRLDEARYERAEALARFNHRGIWSLSLYESPQDYRRR